MSVNNINCCVFGCHSKKGRNKDLSFHKFPTKNQSFVCITNRLGIREKVDKYQAWMMKLNMGKPATKYMKVCSLHFNRDDFILPGVPTKMPRLKSTAIPSQKLPEKSIVAKTKMPRKYLNREIQVKNSATKIETCSDHTSPNLNSEPSLDMNQPTLRNLITLEKEAVEALLCLQDIPTTEDICKKDNGVQVTSGDIVVPFIHTIKSDKELNTMAGIPTFALFHVIVAHCEEVFGKFTNKNKLSLKERVLLTFMKLKNAFSYAVLAVLFRTITSTTCCNIVHETLIMLSKVLEPAIYLPSIDEIQLNMPKCFQNFKRARIVIDCTEIPAQRVKSLQNRIKTYSNYKKCYTLKYMTAVTPAGLIAFVSKGYPGRFSDKSIFEQSGLVEQLEMYHDEIMVDKGFLIKTVTDNYGVTVIQPPFLRKQKQFSKEYALLNQNIAKARVHIERVNQRIKIFDIFKKPLPASLWDRADDIFLITCAIVNLTSPVLDDCRFLPE